MNKFLGNLKSKSIALVASAICACNVMAVTAFAAESGGGSSGLDYGTITTALTTGLNEAASGIMSMIAAIAPIGIGIFGITWCVGKAKQVFKKLTG